MDPATLIAIAGTYAASMVLNKCAELTIEEALVRMTASIKYRLGGRDPEPDDYFTPMIRQTETDKDQTVLKEAQRIFARSPALRRAEMIGLVLQDARLLWVDDVPDNNVYERNLLNSLGIGTDLARSTDEALGKLTSKQHYDVVISDMSRYGTNDAGLQLLRAMRERDHQLQVIFYLMQIDAARGTPPGAFGATERPDELLYYIFDVLERERV